MEGKRKSDRKIMLLIKEKIKKIICFASGRVPPYPLRNNNKKENKEEKNGEEEERGREKMMIWIKEKIKKKIRDVSLSLEE